MTTRHLVVDLQSSAPHLRLPEWGGDWIRGIAPPGWQVTVVSSTAVTAGNGTSQASDESVAAMAYAEVFFGYGITAPLVQAAPALRWAHSASAGIGGSITPILRERVRAGAGLVFTNSAGVYAEVMAETVLASVLHFVRGLDLAVQQQAQAVWNQHPFATGDRQGRELNEHRVLIIGAGGIGTSVATRFAALGCRCTGIRRRPELGPPPGFARVVGLDALDAELAEADVVVIAAPETEATKALVDDARLALLPLGAIVVNVARGSLLAEAALLKALDAGRLRGAVLDVFQTEPLPVDSLFWTHPRVLVLPHVSGVSPRRQWTRVLELFEDNWRRYVAGTPLRNVVDLDAGY